jgi:hypothetical protein
MTQMVKFPSATVPHVKILVLRAAQSGPTGSPVYLYPSPTQKPPTITAKVTFSPGMATAGLAVNEATQGPGPPSRSGQVDRFVCPIEGKLTCVALPGVTDRSIQPLSIPAAQ